MKKLLALAAIALLSNAAAADQVYTGLGTTGLKLGYAHAFGERFGIRGEYNGLNYSHDFSTSDADYSGKLKFSSLGAYLDYFPFDSGFRLSGGALIGNNRISADGRASNGVYTINGQQYSAAGETISASGDWPTVQPYLGLGYGFSPKARGGFGFYADAGIAFGRPDAQLSTSPGLRATAGAANIEAERQRLQDKFDDLRYYPVINIGVSYRF